MEQTLTQQVDALFVNMENFTQRDGLIGKPVTQGDKTFLPVMSITLGYGGGDTQTQAKQPSGQNAGMGGSMLGGAMGLGAKLNTEAVIIIDKDEVYMAHMSAVGSMGTVLDKIPKILSSMKGQQSGQQGQGGQQGQQQQGQQGQNQSQGQGQGSNFFQTPGS